MTVKIKHHYKNLKGIWEYQFFTYENVTKVETEYQPQNGNSYWLHMYWKNGEPQGEYFEIDFEPGCFDTIQIE